MNDIGNSQRVRHHVAVLGTGAQVAKVLPISRRRLPQPGESRGTTAAARVRRADSSAGLVTCSSEHDDRACAEDRWPSRAPAPNPVNDGFEVIKVTDADPGQCVWIAREGERLDHLGKIGYGRVDRRDLSSGREPKFDKSLDLAARHAVIQEDGIPADQADLFQADYPAFGGRGREPHKPADLARGLTGVGGQHVDDRLVSRVDRDRIHLQIVTRSSLSRSNTNS
jgi:hypothetical protein